MCVTFVVVHACVVVGHRVLASQVCVLFCSSPGWRRTTLHFLLKSVLKLLGPSPLSKACQQLFYSGL